MGKLSRYSEDKAAGEAAERYRLECRRSRATIVFRVFGLYGSGRDLV